MARTLKYKTSVGLSRKGTAVLHRWGDGKKFKQGGYLWMGQREPTDNHDRFLCYLDERQLDAIALQWCRHRKLKP